MKAVRRQLLAFLSVLMLAMLACGFGVVAQAADKTTDPDFFETQDLDGGKSVIVTKYTGADRTVIIPSYIKEKKVVAIGSDVLANKSETHIVKIPDTVTEIKAKAFAGCTELTEVFLGENVKTIGESAFDGCKKLVYLQFNTALRTIGKRAFALNNFSGYLEIPGNVTKIGESAFLSNRNLNSVKLGVGVREIGDNAFSDCVNLSEIEIPRSVTKLGNTIMKYVPNVTVHVFKNSIADIEIQKYNEKVGIVPGENLYHLSYSLQEVPADKVAVDKDAVVLYIGQSVELNAVASAKRVEEAMNRIAYRSTTDPVIWKSFNTSRAMVDEDGVVTAVSAGVATVRAEANENAFADIKVTILPISVPEITEKGKKAEQSVHQLDNKKKLTLATNLRETTDGGRVYNWSSSDEKIAKIGQDGVVTPVANAEGKVVMSATVFNGAKVDYELEITKLRAAWIGYTTATSAVINQTVQLPYAAGYHFSSANEKIATVTEGGLIKGMELGTTTVKVWNDTYTATVNVTVTGPLKEKI
ncbi:MAG: leucine-rich repeat domain-containing protein, partial [Eubacteriales bacterium]|nr:leucine-rich repeat domain-containing protein [Eubacteriales bacterium]